MLKYTSLLLGMGVTLSSLSSVKAMDFVAPDLEPHQARALFRQAPCEVDFDNGHAERMGHLDTLQPLLPSGVLDIVKSYVVKPPVLEWRVIKSDRTYQPAEIEETDAVVCEGVQWMSLRYRLERNGVVVAYLDLPPLV